MKVNGFFKDVGGAGRIVKARQQKIANASSVPDPKDPIRALADKLHPAKMEFVVTDISDTSPTSKTFRFQSADGHIPPFQCGQYVIFDLKIGESLLTRPYTISSAPYEARGDKPFFEVTIRRNVSYLVPDYFFENVKVGDHIAGNMPFGSFYYEPMRDSKNVVALAGGSGITAFRSMAKEIAHGSLDCDLTILYGSVNSKDIIFGRELEELSKSCQRVKLVNVMSDDPDWQGEKGFITRELIEKYSNGDTTYMFVGPAPMFSAVKKSLDAMGVGPRRFRHDVLGQPRSIADMPGYPAEAAGKTFTIKVMRGVHEDDIKAVANESVAVSLERAGIPIDAHCRGGECGFCRSQLLEGKIFVNPIGDGRRLMDREMDWFHACSAYPVSDLKIKIPII